MSDIRNAFRAMKAAPVVSLVAILSLALGIGANTAIFSILDSLMMRSLPVSEPQRLVTITRGSWTNPIWEQVRDRSHLFDGAFAWSSTRFNLASSGQTELVDGIWAGGSYFEVLGVPSILGRTLTAADDRRGGGPDGPVAVISYSFWQRRFSGAADVIGRSLTVERVPFTIVGVTPPTFFGTDVGRTFDVVIPLGTEPLIRGRESSLDRRSSWWLSIMLRLKPDQSLSSATATLRGVQPQIRDATMPQDWREQDKANYLSEAFVLETATNGTSGLRQRYQRPLTTIMVVVGLVLLDRVREHRQPPHGARRRAAARTEPAARAGRVALAPRAPAARREPRRIRARRAARPCVRAMGQPAARAAAFNQRQPGVSGSVSGLARSRLHRSCRHTDGSAVWNRAGAPGYASATERGA